MSGTNHVLNVLMIDDSKADFVFVSQLLTFRPKDTEPPSPQEPAFSTSWADSFASAIASIKANDFDAILLDYFMPDVDGFEALQAVVNTVPLTPAIVLTGMNSDELGQRCVELGAQDFVIKTMLSRQSLIRTIRYAIARLRAIKDGTPPNEFDNRFYSDAQHLRGMREAARALRGT